MAISWEKVEQGEAPRNPGRRRFLIALAGACLAGVSLDAAFIEPGWLQVTRHRVPLAGLLPALDGLRVVQLSDLHRGPDVREERIAAAVRAANALAPDLVVLTGDFVSESAEYAPSCARALAGLQAPRGVFAVPGNHDHWRGVGRVMGALRAVGIQDLTNSSTLAAPGLRLTGIDDLWTGRPDWERALAGHRREEALMLLCHSPNVLGQAVEHGLAAFCLAGHTHGGQICLPPIPRRWLPGVGGSPYISGWYALQDARLYVNRGIGTVFLPLRLFCRPEVSLFVLTPHGPPASALGGEGAPGPAAPR